LLFINCFKDKFILAQGKTEHLLHCAHLSFCLFCA